MLQTDSSFALLVILLLDRTSTIKAFLLIFIFAERKKIITKNPKNILLTGLGFINFYKCLIPDGIQRLFLYLIMDGSILKYFENNYYTCEKRHNFYFALLWAQYILKGCVNNQPHIFVRQPFIDSFNYHKKLSRKKCFFG